MLTDDDGTKETPIPEGKKIRLGIPPKLRKMNRKERRRRDALNRRANKNGK